MCRSPTGIEVAHVRFGSGAGMGQKPDDWRTVSLCKDCHRTQHEMGEQSFWAMTPINELIDAFCKASPKAREIFNHRLTRVPETWEVR